MMLPILISVSVAPVSYFFCASAPLADTANKANAVEAMANGLAITGMTSLPRISTMWNDVCHGFLDPKALGDLRRGYHFARRPTIKSPCGKAAGAASLVAGLIL